LPHSADERTSKVAVHAQGKPRATIRSNLSAPFTAIALIYGNIEPQFERQRILVALNSLGKLL
jgi:hypothetical protein